MGNRTTEPAGVMMFDGPDGLEPQDMSAEKRIVDFWGEENLVKARRQDLSMTRLDQSTQVYLSETGLPKGNPLEIEFTISEGIPRLFDHALSIGVSPLPEWGSLRRIGTSIGPEICIGEFSGIIKAVSITDEIPDEYINSSVAALGKSLMSYEWFLKARRDAVDLPTIRRLVSSFSGRVRRADPHAYENPLGCWRGVIEEMRMETKGF